MPPSLAQSHKDFGHPVRHAFRLGTTAGSDELIWKYAIQINVIVTKDLDFQQYLDRDNRTRIVLDRRGNLNLKTTRDGFLQRLPKILDALDHGERLIEFV